MKHNRDRNRDSDIGKGDDTYNRAFFGFPTWGGLIVVVIIVLYFLFR
ncbi:hypothetical protein [Indiicoccus explosivorum]|nr:hypothetical protein [Indiicoccus explosivorum]